MIVSLKGSGFTSEEILSVMALLEFILRNAIKHETKETILQKELIDLGLPKENVDSICKVYNEEFEKLKTLSTSLVFRGFSLIFNLLFLCEKWPIVLRFPTRL